jgi:hypothetical protein
MASGLYYCCLKNYAINWHGSLKQFNKQLHEARVQRLVLKITKEKFRIKENRAEIWFKPKHIDNLKGWRHCISRLTINLTAALSEK